MPSVKKDLAYQIAQIQRFIKLLLVATAITGLIWLFIAIQLELPQISQLAAVTFLYWLPLLVAYRFAQQGLVAPAFWIVFGAMLLLMLYVSLAIVAGAGLALGLVLLFTMVILSNQLLAERWIGWAAIISIMSGALITLADFYGFDNRLSNPQLEVFLPVMAILVSVLHGLYMIREYRDYGLATKLILAFMFLTLISLAILTYSNLNSSRSALIEQAEGNLLISANQTASIVDSYIFNSLNNVRIQASQPDFVEFLSAPVEQREELKLHINPILEAINLVNSGSYALLDARGINLLDTHPENVGVDESGRSYVKELSPFLPYASSILYLPNFSIPAAWCFSSNVYGSAGRLVGIYRSCFAASVLQGLISQNSALSDEAFPMLVDENFIILANGADPTTISKAIILLSNAQIAQLRAKNIISGGTSESLFSPFTGLAEGLNNLDNQPVFTADDPDDSNAEDPEQAGAVRLQAKPWYLVFIQSQDVFLTPLENQIRISILIVTAIAFLTIVFAVSLAKWLSRPVIELAEAAQRVANGDLTTQAVVRSNDEIGVLATNFNYMTSQLHETLMDLEGRVAERTKALETSAAIGQRLSQILNKELLVREVVEQVQRSFDYYHVHIYLLNPAGDKLLMSGGTGAAGQQMLARGHSLNLGQGLVGQTALSKQITLVSDVTQNKNWLPNPLLPDTKAEIAVPILQGEQLVGVLDVQQNRANSLQQTDIELLQLIASQVAVALQNAQQFHEAQRRAGRESQINQIVEKIQGTNTIEEAIQTAVREIGRATNARQTIIYLTPQQIEELPKE